MKLEALFHREGGSPDCGDGVGWRAQHPFPSPPSPPPPRNHVVPNTKPWGRSPVSLKRLSQEGGSGCQAFPVASGMVGQPAGKPLPLCLSLLCLSLRLLLACEETLPWSQATPRPPVPLPSPRRLWLTPWPENSLDHSHPGAVISPTLHSRPHWESCGEPCIPPSASRPALTQHLRGDSGDLTWQGSETPPLPWNS